MPCTRLQVDTAALSDCLKPLLTARPIRSISGMVRAMMPEIEEALARGWTAKDVAEKLSAQCGHTVQPSFLRTILSTVRKERRANGGTDG